MQEVRRNHRASLCKFAVDEKFVSTSVIVNLVGVMDNAQSVLKSAANNIGELQSDHIQSQKSVIVLQDELIRAKLNKLLTFSNQ